MSGSRLPVASTPLPRRRSARGQTTTEWLMIAGVLTAVAVVLIGYMSPAIRYYTRGIILSVRTVAP